MTRQNKERYIRLLTGSQAEWQRTFGMQRIAIAVVMAVAVVCMMSTAASALSLNTVNWVEDNLAEGKGSGTIGRNIVSYTSAAVGNAGQMCTSDWNTSPATQDAVGDGATHLNCGTLGVAAGSEQEQTIDFTEVIVDPILLIGWGHKDISFTFPDEVTILTPDPYKADNIRLIARPGRPGSIRFTRASGQFTDGFAIKITGIFGPGAALTFKINSTSATENHNVGFTIGPDPNWEQTGQDIAKHIDDAIQAGTTYEPQVGKAMQAFRNPPEVKSENGVLKKDLVLGYADNLIWNPKEKKTVKLHLRNYDGGLVGHTWRVKPGDILWFQHKNQLPVETPPVSELPGPHGHNGPHQLNTTNLHFHGFHVSPAAHSDNVLAKIAPQTQRETLVWLPKDHPTGTFWYHPHTHGSTAMQVSSGAAGAIIVEGGFDDDPALQNAEERIFVMQQIPYRKHPQHDYYDVELRGDTVHKLHDDFLKHLFHPVSWQKGFHDFGWQTTINGQFQPMLIMKTGTIEHWRFIHAGVREHIRLFIAKLGSPTKIVKQYRIALDGLATGKIDGRINWVDLFPGYRVDTLVQFDEPGDYVLLDLGVRQVEALFPTPESPKIIGVIAVRDSVEGISPHFVQPKAWPTQMPGGDDFEEYQAHETLVGQPINKDQFVRFTIKTDFSVIDYENGVCDPALIFGVGKCQCAYEQCSCEKTDPAMDTAFNPNDAPRLLNVGNIDRWTLTSGFGSVGPFPDHFGHPDSPCQFPEAGGSGFSAQDMALSTGHPFHIHVNPFEVTSLKDRSGKEHLETNETLWKDTLFVPNGWTATVLSKYTKFTGDFVYHCHILNHEDDGMMEKVRIVGPGGPGAWPNPNLSPFTAGTKIALQADNGEWFSRCRDCQQTVGNIPDTIVTRPIGNADGTPTEPDAHFYVIDVGNGKVALWADTRNYVARCNGCIQGGAKPDSVTVHATDPTAASAQFTPLLQPNGKYALQADTGKYLARCNGCSPGSTHPNTVTIHVDNPAGAPQAQWTVKALNNEPEPLN